MGVSLKRFDGWTPRQATVVTSWDDQGRPAGWVTTEETEWDTRERSMMLALGYFEGGCCQRCGEHLAKAMDPANDPDNLFEATGRWVAEGPDECFSCKALVKAEAALNQEEGGAELANYAVFTPKLIPITPRRRPGIPAQ